MSDEILVQCHVVISITCKIEATTRPRWNSGIANRRICPRGGGPWYLVERGGHDSQTRKSLPEPQSPPRCVRLPLRAACGDEYVYMYILSVVCL